MKLSSDLRAQMRHFAYSLGNGTLCERVLGDIDYLSALTDGGSVLEMVFAIWMNVVEIDEDGKVLNRYQASKRAAQYLRAYCDRTYVVEPEFEDWETELHCL